MAITLTPELTAYMQILGQNIREARLARNWTQAAMAERMLVSTLTLKKVESGAPGVAFGTYLAALDLFDLGEQITQLAAPHTDIDGSRLRLMQNRRARRRAT